MRRVVLAVMAMLGGAALACTETRRSLGEECLKGDDCVSGVCAARSCVGIAPLLDASPLEDDAGDGGAPSDGSDATSPNSDGAADARASDDGAG